MGFPAARPAPIFSVILVAFIWALLPMSPASADSVICEAGSAAGHCTGPQGVAVDSETGRVFVADSGNERIDVFGADGPFIESFSDPQVTWVAVDNDAGSASRHDL